MSQKRFTWGKHRTVADQDKLFLRLNGENLAYILLKESDYQIHSNRFKEWVFHSYTDLETAKVEAKKQVINHLSQTTGYCSVEQFLELTELLNLSAIDCSTLIGVDNRTVLLWLELSPKRVIDNTSVHKLRVFDEVITNKVNRTLEQYKNCSRSITLVIYGNNKQYEKSCNYSKHLPLASLYRTYIYRLKSALQLKGLNVTLIRG